MNQGKHELLRQTPDSEGLSVTATDFSLSCSRPRGWPAFQLVIWVPRLFLLCGPASETCAFNWRRGKKSEEGTVAP